MKSRAIWKIAFGCTLGAGVVGCSAAAGQEQGDPVDPGASNSSPRAAAKSEDPVGAEVVATMDQATDPCDDFFQYACGGWLASTELPADEPRFGRSSELRDENLAVLRQILEEGAAKGTRAGQFYAACVDEDAARARGPQALAPQLAQIDKTKRKNLMRTVGNLHRQGSAAVLFNFGLFLDFEQPDLHILAIDAGGLGLPDRAFYLDESRKPVLDAYTGHVARMLGFLGKSPEDAAASAQEIVKFETALATLHRPREQMREVEKLYHRLDRKGVEKAAKLDWKAYFKAVGKPDAEAINVTVPEFLEGLPKVLAETDEATIRDYLRFHLISSNAARLSPEIDQAAFAFEAAITGASAQPPRWERCVNATNGSLGDLVSQDFVSRAFPGDSKDIAVDMIQRIEAAFAAGLPALAWMDDTTRAQALEKMRAVDNKIGYPEIWREYEGLTIGADYLENVVAAAEHDHRRDMGKVGTKVDPREWGLPASIVNAGYNPLENSMTFPAGILQPPFFKAGHPQAMNYGGIGMVMGHELTHGFDDAGRKFDGSGKLRQWWSDEVTARFETEATCLVDAYANYEVQPGLNVNGKLTLGENIADFGGLKEAFSAYEAWVAEHGEEKAIVDNLSNEQLFFVAYAQGWCSMATPEIEALLTTVDPHSPPKARVNIPLAHSPEFWEAFSCGEGVPMRAKNACEVW